MIINKSNFDKPVSKLTDSELIDELYIRLENNVRALKDQKRLEDELKVVNAKLEESETLKSHFISNITNEILNPFASIIGLSKAILHVEKENWKKVFSMVALIYSEASSLDFQLKNIFAAAKIEAGDIFPEIGRVDICNLNLNIVSSLKIEAKKKKITFEPIYDFDQREKSEDGIVYFKTDPEKLKLILLNMLSNALKFSYEETTIYIKFWIDDNNLFLSVKDTGSGISEEHQKLIFDRFKRVDSRISSLNRGHGLGLSIIKALLDLLGGEIMLKSIPDLGTTFTIRIPEANEDTFLMASGDNELFFNDNQVF
jgi:signal transduction histidine kinase